MSEFSKADLLFKRSWQCVASAANYASVPTLIPPEIAFFGRSNVGKSSLINALTFQNKLARTSRTPGRTKQLHFFSSENTLTIVDLPGYGYAAVSKKEKAAWQELVFSYFRHRSNLQRVALLIDSRRGIGTLDREWISVFEEMGVSYQLILTKIDKISLTEKEVLLSSVKAETVSYAALYPVILPLSVKEAASLAELRTVIADIALYCHLRHAGVA